MTSGQSYKHFTLVNYDSRVVPDLKILHITTVIYERKMFIRLATGGLYKKNLKMHDSKLFARSGALLTLHNHNL